jgi:Icc-related predicted phosphoesterase
MSFLERDPNADLTFGVLSDLHMTHRGEGVQKLNQYLALYSRITPAIDAHVFAGDIVYQIDISGGGVCGEIYPEPYAYLKMAYDRYAKDVPLVYTIGNHEYPQNRAEEEISTEARELFKKEIGPLCTHRVIKGYHFITVGIWDWRCGFREEDEEWAMKEIRRALKESGSNPVFVVYHPPIQNTVIHSYGKHHSDKFEKFLTGNRRIVNICGHLHTPMQNPRNIWQKAGGATVIHAPMSAVGNMPMSGSSKREICGMFYSQSLFFEVTGTKIVIHKIDNLNEREDGEPFVIDVAGEQCFTPRRFQIAKKPAFPAGATAEAEYFRGLPHFRFPKAYSEVTPGNADSEVPIYRFDFYKKGEKTPTASVTWHSDAMRSVHRDHFRSPVAVKLEGGDYTVKITPISFFEKEGRPITAKLKMPKVQEEPMSWPFGSDMIGFV